MRVLLLRHGSAINPGDAGCPAEQDRFLTDKGKQEVADVARGLAQINEPPDFMLASPYVRAVQTAEIAAGAFGFPPEKIVLTPSLTPSGSPEHLFAELSRLDAQRVMCCGHAPNVDAVVAYALNSPVQLTSLKKAGVAWLEMDLLDPPRGYLAALFLPAALRAIGA